MAKEKPDGVRKEESLLVAVNKPTSIGTNDYSDYHQHVRDLLFQHVPDLIFIKDSEFRIVQANPAFLAMYPPEARDKVIGSTTFEAYPEDQMREFVAEDQKALDEGFSEVQEIIDMPYGKTRTLLTRKIGFDDQDGKRYIFGIARDVTEMKETEASLENANQELEEFAYRVSHDLRAPLVSSVRLLELALIAMKNGDTEEANNLVEISLSSMTSLEKLAEDTLNLQKIKRAELVVEPINIRAEIEDVWLINTIDEAIQLNLTIDVEEFEADRQGIRMLLENLLSNAIKYQDEAQPNKSVSIAVSSSEHAIHLSIRDNGVGFPEKQRHKIFLMFERFHPKMAFGTGLGLYMIKRWVERIGGSIEVVHQSPGTEFLVKIPQHHRVTRAD